MIRGIQLKILILLVFLWTPWSSHGVTLRTTGFLLSQE
ncbi:hypothetical protein APHACPA_0773 [Rickettsia amblyommatis str. Ac/Pa]|uniref:Uncharacterized protein n=1 Tax=Rickettsia amblyommatis str. Ac/Pa TaxID=1359164 RepID=A0A0F3N4D5_RICAM|nr:hypothetical protein APHACPA_0773 [Rickettsia amblyommatis str. Ac/Pa]